jgi:branched-chain amino acid transport system permease protein
MTLTSRFGRPVAAVAVAGLFALLPWMGLNNYWVRQVILVAILSLVVSGLNTSLGYAGELAVSQVALYAVGAYVSGYLAVTHGVHDIGLCLLAAIAAVVLVGLVTGIPGLRLGGWSLAMVSFFLVLIIPSALDLLRSQTGGAEGLAGIPVPTFAGLHLNGRSFYLFVVIVAALWFAALRNLIRSPHGDAFLVLKQSPILAASLGISVYRLKLLAYVVGAIPAGVAGVLFAFLSGYISPTSFSLGFAFTILTASIVGGSQSVLGAVFGAAVLQLGSVRIASFQNYSLIVYGAFLVVAGLVFSEGAAGLLRAGSRRLPDRARRLVSLNGSKTRAAPDVPATLPALRGERLTVEGASKVFGGLRALDDVTLDAAPGQVTALIGPNGSGKTTLLNLICGFYRPTAGRILLGPDRIDTLNPYRTARAGVARTFQTPLVPKGMTTRAFVATGTYISHRVRIPAAVLRTRFFRRRVASNDQDALAILGLLGIGEQADTEVDTLPLGTRRLAEVARCLASEPRVFLFDEVGSGLDEADLRRLEGAIDLIRRAGGTVVLVEHNFPLVLKIADSIHVLSNGALLASGTPEEIQTDPRVLEEYTGARVSSTLGSETIAELGAAAHTGDSS